ncbi:MAG: hypothetical protein R6W85_12060, partial [Gillisia sp.]
NEKILKTTFWSLNIGLMAMALLSLLPMGIWQAIASIEHGMWYARSSELMQNPNMITLKWLRTIGDVIFAVGMLTLCWFVFDLTLKNRNKQPNPSEINKGVSKEKLKIAEAVEV